MTERTEEQKIFHEPIKVVFGGKEFEIEPLVIKESRVWRAKVWEVMVELPKTTKVSSTEPDKFEAALNSMLISTPNTVIDLFFAYAKNLNREEIEGIATETEMAIAWQKVAELAFPLLPGLVKTIAMAAPPKTKPQ